MIEFKRAHAHSLKVIPIKIHSITMLLHSVALIPYFSATSVMQAVMPFKLIFSWKCSISCARETEKMQKKTTITNSDWNKLDHEQNIVRRNPIEIAHTHTHTQLTHIESKCPRICCVHFCYTLYLFYYLWWPITHSKVRDIFFNIFAIDFAHLVGLVWHFFSFFFFICLDPRFRCLLKIKPTARLTHTHEKRFQKNI